MKAGKNGESSAPSIRDVAMDFEGGIPGKTVVSDVAFVQDENREILIVGASTDNNVVLVDLSTFETRLGTNRQGSDWATTMKVRHVPEKLD